MVRSDELALLTIVEFTLGRDYERHSRANMFMLAIFPEFGLAVRFARRANGWPGKRNASRGNVEASVFDICRLSVYNLTLAENMAKISCPAANICHGN